MRFNDALPGLLVVALALAGLFLVSRFPSFPGEQYGPGLFPALILLGLLGGGAILVVQGLRARAAGGPWLHLEGWARSWRTYATLGLIAGALLFYIGFAATLGFMPTGFLIVFAVLLWMRGPRRAPVSAAVAMVATLTIFAVFAKVLRVPLPRGELAGWLF